MYLAQKGRTEADLAAVLWDKNWTAQAELYDDLDVIWERSVAYPPELKRLHSHIINENTAASRRCHMRTWTPSPQSGASSGPRRRRSPVSPPCPTSPPRSDRQACGTVFPPSASLSGPTAVRHRSASARTAATRRRTRPTRPSSRSPSLDRTSFTTPGPKWPLSWCKCC
ncbi:hypothetical protein B0H17DRAFT_592778 [Mycena rosella]|uniref:T4 RNA ligase 1-like N-terminal domain-containing protein n=1 Tax=Mycena rosella TaxID=1033263 RepID=A0AAD7FJ40_MYCRO|nr:hypothetical protein B0H17DRAFT_592778 [Mycena rosella]